MAGLIYALKVADHGTVCLLSKTSVDDTATSYAQGGIAAVMYSPDSYHKHIADTINAGSRLNDEEIVRITITESTERIDELIDWGTHFDKEDSGKFSLSKEGGHSEHRILHHKDATGYEIQRALSKKIREHGNIEVLESHFAIDLITQHHLGEMVTRDKKDISCFGVYAMNKSTNEVETILAKTTMLEYLPNYNES